MLAIVAVSTLLAFLHNADGHGMMLEPPNRSSLWRYNSAGVINYDDNALYCGGAYVQWTFNDGNCGLCGDSYTDPSPRANENTGTYGQGIIARTYEAGSLVNVEIHLVKNHLGTFQFSLCELEDSSLPESGEDCFQVLSLNDGSTEYAVSSEEVDVQLAVQLPEGQTCERCVLRWHYRAGNNWGDCGNGTYGLGCGPQETFRNCADIAIV